MTQKLLVFALAMMAVGVSNSQSVITAWDFETAIDAPSTGTGTNVLIGTFAGGTTGTGSNTGCSQQSGTGAWQIGTATPGETNESSGIEFKASTVDFENILFEYDHRTSNTGTRTTRIQYTLDGIEWLNLDVTSSNYSNACSDKGGIDLGRIDVANPVGTNGSDAWSRRFVNLSAIEGADDNANFGVRILAAHYAETGEFRQANNVNNIATAGTWRLDNVAFKGSVILPPPANISIVGTHETVSESVDTVSLTLNITDVNELASTVEVTVLAISTASQEDYTIANSTVTFPANVSGPQSFDIIINDDNIAEQTEYLVIQLTNPYNAVVTGTGRYFLYIKDNDRNAPEENNELSLQLLSSYQNAVEGDDSAEIVAHDPATQRLAVANSIGNKIDILDLSNPAALVSVASIDISTYGHINSIAVYNSIIAAAIENEDNPQDSGKVIFLNMNGVFISEVTVGAMPDMLTFNHAGNKVLVACEGEPNAAYDQDPEGRVCIIDVAGGFENLQQEHVLFVNFTSYIGQEDELRAQGIRIFGPNANAAQDFEPEYITISDDDSTAWVSLQENNALAVIDIATGEITDILPLGFKDHSLFGNGFDISDQTSAINIANFPVKGVYMPDAIAQINIGGTTYVLTANEGDAREYDPIVESVRLGSNGYVLDEEVFPNAAALKANQFLGRLNVLNTLGDTDGDGDFDEIYSLGARSFSIWNGATGELVYDSGDDFEMITSTHPQFTAIFNASNTSGSAVSKNRSDDKGPEPEGVTVAQINGNNYAFISLERIGGAMIYNINNPEAPYFISYANNRDAATNGPDRGAEGMIYIEPTDSPNGNGLLILANEISSTLSVYQVNSCEQLSGLELTIGEVAICSGDTLDLTTEASSALEYQWMRDGVEVSAATDSILSVESEGSYTLRFANDVANCNATTQAIVVSVNDLPTVVASAELSAICLGDSTSVNAVGAESYVWNNEVENDSLFAPVETLEYIVIGTDINGCIGSDSLTITVNNLPIVIANATEEVICLNEEVTLSGEGAESYVWNNEVENDSLFTPTESLEYIVVGTDINGCSSMDSLTIQVNALPTVVATASEEAIYLNDEVTLIGEGADSYEWNNEVEDGEEFAPLATTTYTVVGTDTNGCANSAQITIAVNPLPTVMATFASGQLTTGNFTTYQWNNGASPVAGQTSQNWTPTQNGNYSVTVTDANGCENTSEEVSVIIVSVNELIDANITVFPNPFNHELRINSNERIGELTVYNAVGEVVFSTQVNGTTTTVNTQNFSNGIYLIQMVGETNNTIRIIKQ